MGASVKNLLILTVYIAFTGINRPSQDFTDDVANKVGLLLVALYWFSGSDIRMDYSIASASYLASSVPDPAVLANPVR
jgi:hypothetical protein